MTEYRPRLWAPARDAVSLWWDDPGTGPGFDGGRTVELRKSDDGWWSADGVELPVGARYGFVLSGDDAPDHPIADPRGRKLPEGVHGPSEVIPAWQSPRWAGREVEGRVIYELHIGTFTPEGTLESAIARLPHLVELGVDFVELLPVNGVNGEWNWGYDGVAWFTVHEPYGGPEAYHRFVGSAHGLGLGVIQDVVYNHLGPSGNFLPILGPYLRSGTRNTWGDSIDFDEREVRSFVLDNTRMWFEDFGVDGLRLDAVHAIVDDDSPVHILREIADQTAALAVELERPLALIAESDQNDPATIEPDGKAMTAQWSDDYHHAVHVALTGETEGYYADFSELSALGKAWSQGFFHDGTYSSFRESEHGARIPDDVPPTRLVVFDQDHDQVGNRATGDRLSATLSPDRLAVGAVLTLCAPGTPMLFMGEEWGASTPWQFFTSHPEEELGRVVAEGRIAEFEKMGWDAAAVPDPQDPETFRRSKLDWSELDQPEHRELYDRYRALIRLRRETSEIGGEPFPQLTADVDDDVRTAALRAGDVVVYVNLGATEWTVPVDDVLFVSSDRVSSPASGDLLLPPDTAVVARYAVR